MALRHPPSDFFTAPAVLSSTDAELTTTTELHCFIRRLSSPATFPFLKSPGNFSWHGITNANAHVQIQSRIASLLRVRSSKRVHELSPGDQAGVQRHFSGHIYSLFVVRFLHAFKCSLQITSVQPAMSRSCQRVRAYGCRLLTLSSRGGP
jgi:hypothetical protein